MTSVFKAENLQKIKAALRSKRPERLEAILSTDSNESQTDDIFNIPGLWVYKRPLTVTSVISLIDNSNEV